MFQSAPRERGERYPSTSVGRRAYVSIRAPRAGRKFLTMCLSSRQQRFNPRPASGAKGEQRLIEIVGTGFQSAPRERGESTSAVRWIRINAGFNPRPASGAKVDPKYIRDIDALFQSAPRERGESNLLRLFTTAKMFQSAPRERGERRPTG